MKTKHKKYKRMTVKKSEKIARMEYERGYFKGFTDGRQKQINEFKQLFSISLE